MCLYERERERWIERESITSKRDTQREGERSDKE